MLHCFEKENMNLENELLYTCRIRKFTRWILNAEATLNHEK